MHVSRATLVVVPSTLVGHWTHQLATHTVLGALRDEAMIQVCMLDRLTMCTCCSHHATKRRLHV